MKVVFFVLAMLAISYGVGALLISTRRGQDTLVASFRAQIGYAYLIVMFYVAYVLLKSMFAATCTVITITLILIFVNLLLKRIMGQRYVSDSDKPGISWRQPLLVAMVAVFLLSSWPYLASGWGEYWHNGNYDIEDGMNGRDAYINDIIFDTKPFQLEKIVGDKSWTDFADKTGTSSLKSKMNDSYWGWYAGDSFRFQYSNLAFWSYVLDERDGMDITIVQAIFNLLLMAMGIYSLARIVFQLSNSWSAMAAFFSVAGSFYLGTFWAGHIGSLMYGSIAPMLATLVLASKSKGEWKSALPWLFLGVGAMAFTYPQALMLGLVYWVGYRIYASSHAALVTAKIRMGLQNNLGRKILFLLIGILVLCVLGYGLWLGTESYRIRQDGQYRAWGLVHDFGMMPVIFGYIPAPSGLFNIYAYWGLTTLGIISTAISLYFCYAYKGVQQRFVRFFVPLWIIGLLFFYIFIRDSYYIYKYLYTHFFVLVIVFCAFIAASKSLLPRIVGVSILFINLVSDVVAGQFIYSMPHNNRAGEYEQLANWDKKVLSTMFVDLTGGEGIAVRQTLKKHKIETELDPRNASYFIIRKGTGGDITGEQLGEVVFSTDLLEIRKSPEKNYLMVRTWFEPEVYPADPLLGSTPYRWIGQGKNDNVGIYVVRPDHVSDTTNPFLRICGQKGPSAVGALTLKISDGVGNKLGKLSLDGTSCVWLPSATVKDAIQPLILRAGLIGKKLHPPEDRTLLYRVFSVAWSNQRYDEKALSLLNPKDDKLGIAADSSVKFGNGWWPPETYDGEHFRWASEGAELLVSRRCGKGRVAMEVEIGPAHGNAPAVFSVADGLGKVFSTTKFSANRQRVEFAISQPGPYRLTTGSERKQIPGDYRILDFRVLAVDVSGC